MTKLKLPLIAVLFLTSTLICSTASAGLFALSHLSRANCVNNESITWDYWGTWSLQVWSLQFHPEVGLKELYDEQWTSNRAAAICVGCGFEGGWHVEGTHYVSLPSSYLMPKDEIISGLERECDAFIFGGDHSFMSPCATTSADSCNLTDW